MESREDKIRTLNQIEQGWGYLSQVKIGDEKYNELNDKEREIVILKEFLRCHLSIEYFAKNYVKVKHPRLGIIPFKPFEYQIDLMNQIDIAYQVLDSELRKELLSKLRFRFDFKKWWKEEIEKNIELVKLVPPELKEQYTIWIHSPFWKTAKHKIILKSRQVGISTTGRIISTKFINFHPSSEIVVISKSDQDSTKFLQETKIIYKNLPPELQFKIIKDNDHQFTIDFSGSKEIVSSIFALAPSENAGSGYSPTLLILDELSKWKQKVEQAFTSATMALSSGGLLLIIGTPYGIGNLYYNLWVNSVKNVIASIGSDVKSEVLWEYSQLQTDGNEDGGQVGGQIEIAPFIVHWTQVPDEEYQRRGFKNKLEWYYAECNKLGWDWKKINQELNLKFIGSGETVFPPTVLEYVNNYCNIETKLIKEGKKVLGVGGHYSTLLEGRELPPTLKGMPKDELNRLFGGINKYLKYIKVFEPPTPDETYIIGVDVSEGIGKDYSTAYVFKVPNLQSTLQKLRSKVKVNVESIRKMLLEITSTDVEDEIEIPLQELGVDLNAQPVETEPICVAEFYYNKIPPLDFAKLLILLGIYYNGAYFNIERNKDGLGVIQYITEYYYDEDKIMNEYLPDKSFPNNFSTYKKGWSENRKTRDFLLTTFRDYVIDNLDMELINQKKFEECNCNIHIPKSVALEMLTFEVKPNGRWEHIEGTHDDGIFGFSLGLIGGILLPTYLNWLEIKQGKKMFNRSKSNGVGGKHSQPKRMVDIVGF